MRAEEHPPVDDSADGAGAPGGLPLTVVGDGGRVGRGAQTAAMLMPSQYPEVGDRPALRELLACRWTCRSPTWGRSCASRARNWA
jgi:hypothetical protein